MSKFVAIAVVCALMVGCYLFLLVVMPILTQFASTANLTMVAQGSDLTRYPGSAEAVLAAPWALFFVPGAIGIILIIMILRKS